MRALRAAQLIVVGMCGTVGVACLATGQVAMGLVNLGLAGINLLQALRD